MNVRHISLKLWGWHSSHSSHKWGVVSFLMSCPKIFRKAFLRILRHDLMTGFNKLINFLFYWNTIHSFDILFTNLALYMIIHYKHWTQYFTTLNTTLFQKLSQNCQRFFCVQHTDVNRLMRSSLPFWGICQRTPVLCLNILRNTCKHTPQYIKA